MARPKPTLNLPESNWTAVWDVVRDRLLSDPVLKSAKFTVEFAEDADSLRSPDGIGHAPVLQVFGTLGRWQWHDQQRQKGALILTFRAYLPTLDPRDVFNLQMALANALNSRNANLDHQRDLVDAGAETGLVVWPQPLTPIGRPDQPKQRSLIVVGSAAIEVTTDVLIV